MQGWVEAGMCRAGLGGGRDVQGWVDGYGDVSIGGGGGGDEVATCSDFKCSSSSYLSCRRQLFARLARR